MHPSVHCSTIFNNQDMETTSMSINERIKKMWHTYAIKYYLAIKKNEIMPFEATWIDLQEDYQTK